VKVGGAVHGREVNTGDLMSDHHPHSQEEDKGQQPQGLAALAELQLIWQRYGADPQMAARLREALADGVVTQAELLSLRARAARAANPGLDSNVGLAEIEAIKLKFGADSDQAREAQEALKDGVVSAEELASLKLMLARGLVREESSPEPKPDPRAIPFPTLEMKTPWRKREDGGSDSGWGP
jgi:hypothetical protein